MISYCIAIPCAAVSLSNGCAEGRLTNPSQFIFYRVTNSISFEMPSRCAMAWLETTHSWGTFKTS